MINEIAATTAAAADFAVAEPAVEGKVHKLLFGVDSATRSDNLLQNNLEQFEWVVRNKIYPCFYGRNIGGENSITKEEIEFLHDKGCKIALIHKTDLAKRKEEQGIELAKELAASMAELKITKGTAVFLEIGESESPRRKFMRGFAGTLIEEGYTPGFKANTDARFSFDREFCRGMLNDTDIFRKCIIWAVSPIIEEFDGITSTHIISPDKWKPYAPSAIDRIEIAVWQYGRSCHPIKDDMGEQTSFNLNLVRNRQIITDKMF